MKKLLIDWQLWLRVVLCFLLPFVLIAALMKASEQGIDQALDTSIVPKIAVIGLDYLSLELRAQLKENAEFEVLENEGEAVLALEEERVDLGLVIPTDFVQDSIVSGTITVYYNSMKSQQEVGLVFDILQEYEEDLVENNLTTIAVDERLVNPIKLDKKNSFNPLLQVGKMFSQAKGIIANVLNSLWLLLCLWLVRYLALKVTEEGKEHFVSAFIFSCLVILAAVFLVLFGVYQGLEIELEGTVKSIVLSTQQALTWKKVSPMFYLWIVLGWAIMGMLGIVASLSNDALKATNRTYWIVIVLMVFAMFGFAPVEVLGMGTLATPLINVFAVGQVSLSDTITATQLWTSMGIMIVLAFLFNGLWYKMLKK